MGLVCDIHDRQHELIASADAAMPLHIRDPRAAQLARKLAERRGQTLTEAVIAALESEQRRDTERRPLAARLDAIARELAAKGSAAKARGVTKDEIDALWGNA